MKPWFKFLFILLFLLAGIVCSTDMSYAQIKDDPTGNWNFNETTGIINMPSARTLPYRTVRLTIGMADMGKFPPIKHKWQAKNPGPATGTPFDSDWWIWNEGDRRLLISPIKNVEFGFMNIHSQELMPSVSAKWVALPETKNFPAIAIGAQNIFGLKEDNKESKIYSPQDPEVVKANSKIAPFIVASKFLGPNDMFDVSLGFGGGRFRNRIFYGGEMFFDKKHLFSAVGEFNGVGVAYGLKYRMPNQRWNFGLYMQDKYPAFEFGYTMPW